MAKAFCSCKRCWTVSFVLYNFSNLMRKNGPDCMRMLCNTARGSNLVSAVGMRAAKGKGKAVANTTKVTPLLPSCPTAHVSAIYVCPH